MKSIPSFYADLLLKLSLTQSILLQHSLPKYSVCGVASLVNTFTQAFLEVLLHSLQHVGRNCCHFFPDVLFQIYHCPWFLFIHLALEISSEEEVLRLGTLVLMNIEVLTKYPLSHDRIVFLSTSPQQQPNALKTSAPWQMKCFEFH
jgi:hypothetical protein